MANLTEQRTETEQWLIDTGPFGEAIDAERNYQDRKWGAPPLHVHTPAEWGIVLMKEFGEAWAELYKLTFAPEVDNATRLNLRRELVQVAALCAAICDEMEAL